MKLTQDKLTVEIGGSSGVSIYHDGSLYEDYHDAAKIASGEVIPLPKLVFDPDALVGLDSIPSMRRDNTPRPTSHGIFAERGYTDGRLMTLTGQAISESPEQLQDLRDLLASYLNTGDLITINFRKSTEALSRTAQGYLEGDLDWTRMFDTYATWKFNLICPDPRLYGTKEKTAQVLSSDTSIRAGIQYKMRYPITYTRGRTPPKMTTITNVGNSEAYPKFEVPGPNYGFTIKDNKARIITFNGSTAKGDSVIVDTYKGTAIRNKSDVSYLLTRRDWITIPPKQKGGSIQVSIDYSDTNPLVDVVEETLVMNVRYRDTWI